MTQRDPNSDIVIAGYDMITPFGDDLEAQWSAFAQGKSGINWIHRYPLEASDAVRIAGQIPPVDFSKETFWNERDAGNWFSPVIFHAMRVAQRAVEDAALHIDEKNAHRIGITFSSAIGGLDAMIHAENQLRNGRTPHPFTNPNGCLNLVGGKVSILTGAKGPIYAPVAACATGAASVANAAMLIETGRADAVIAGACDFPVIRSLVSSFGSMNGAFKHPKPTDRAHDNPALASRPFSKDRRGFVVSEGAAALIVMSRKYARENGLRIRGVMQGFGMTSDAAHFVAPSLPTIVACIREALRHAELAPSDIDAINAHAASTSVGDATELSALAEVFGKDHRIPISANKSQIGHTMGASSAIELILALEGMTRNTLLPTMHYEPDPASPCNDAVANTARAQTHSTVLSNSFGFGGCNVCLVVRGES